MNRYGQEPTSPYKIRVDGAAFTITTAHVQVGPDPQAWQMLLCLSPNALHAHASCPCILPMQLTLLSSSLAAAALPCCLPLPAYL